MDHAGAKPLSDELIGVDEYEVHDLATAFALGELDEPGLHRLHELLRAEGELGRRAAHHAWRALAIHQDLHAARGDTFQRTVSAKVAANREGFLGQLLGRLGWKRPALAPVPTPPAPGRRIPWLWLLWPQIALIAVVWWAFSREPTLVVVTASQGAVYHDGDLVLSGHRLRSGPLAIADGASLTLQWDHGSSVALSGPAQVLVTEAGLAISGGRLRASGAAQDLGLPDGRLRLEADSIAEILVLDGASTAGVMSGQARWIPARSGESLTLTAGEAVSADRVFPWRRVSLAEIGSERWHSGLPTDATAWSLELMWQPDGATSQLRVLSDDVEWLSLGGARLWTGGQRLPLSGPPALERRLRLQRLGSQAWADIDGFPARLPLPLGPPPSLEIHGGGTVHAVSGSSGPALSAESP